MCYIHLILLPSDHHTILIISKELLLLCLIFNLNLIHLLITLLPQTACPPYQFWEIIRYLLQSLLIRNRPHRQKITQSNDNSHQLIITLEPLLQLCHLKDNNININPRYQYTRLKISTKHQNLKIDRRVNILIYLLIIDWRLCIVKVYVI